MDPHELATELDRKAISYPYANTLIRIGDKTYQIDGVADEGENLIIVAGRTHEQSNS
jgi:hypothetical protein